MKVNCEKEELFDGSGGRALVWHVDGFGHFQYGVIAVDHSRRTPYYVMVDWAHKWKLGEYVNLSKFIHVLVVFDLANIEATFVSRIFC